MGKNPPPTPPPPQPAPRPFDRVCRYCGEDIRQREGTQLWEDMVGFNACPRGISHLPDYIQR